MAETHGREIKTGLWYLIWRLVLIVLIAIMVHVVMASWVWPDKQIHLKRVLSMDLARIGQFDDGGPASMRAYHWASQAYHWVFEDSGFNGMIRTFAKPAGVNPPDTELRKVVVYSWPEIQASMYSVQIIGERMAVLFMTLPLFLIAAFLAISDGWAKRWLRRAHGGRESSFLYHRTKRGIFLVVVLLWAIYLILPISTDPRIIIFPFVLAFGLLIRSTVEYFKKYF